MVHKNHFLTVGMALLLLFCVAGAVWTAYWSLWFGLAPRPRLSLFQTMLRVLVVIVALLLCWRRRDLTERIALACAVVAAGSSALYGQGVSSTTLQVVRLLFHFLGYSIGAVAILRWFASGDKRRSVRRARLTLPLGILH